MKRYNFFLPEDVVAELKKIAAQKSVAYSDLIRQAIKEFLDRTNGRAGAN